MCVWFDTVEQLRRNVLIMMIVIHRKKWQYYAINRNSKLN